MSETTLKKENKSSYKILFLILVSAVSARFLWMLAEITNIGGEGVEYARLAENLLKGNGYVGIYGLGTQLIFPPLYSLLIASFSLVTGDFELAGRVVSLIMGSALVLPIFFIALHMYGRRVALIAASLVAFHPLLIQLSASVYTEATYFTLLMGGVYWASQTVEHVNLKTSVLSGICFGVAYLTRPEAIVFPFLTVLTLIAVAVVKRTELKTIVIQSLWVVIPFSLLAAPYVIFLSIHTGQLRFEGKSINNYTIGKRMTSGMDYMEASYGIDENLNEEGPSLKNNLEQLRSVGKISLGEVASYIGMAARKNVKIIYHIVFSSPAFGSPILITLVILGIFGTPWSRERINREGFLFLVLLFVLVSLLAVQHFWDRYAFVVLPFLILWASKGIEEFSEWAESTAASLKYKLLQNGNSIRVGVRSVLSIILILYATTDYLDEFKNTGAQKDPIKEAGLWLRGYIPGSKKIMDTSSVIPYYAGGTWTPLPYAGSSLALKYIHHKRPDFIVLTANGSNTRPYVREWIQNGIPDSNAKLVYNTDGSEESRITIYQWDSSDKPH
jgi:Dolichyl-phosphate-mannose-protein mannosyltransferase